MTREPPPLIRAFLDNAYRDLHDERSVSAATLERARECLHGGGRYSSWPHDPWASLAPYLAAKLHSSGDSELVYAVIGLIVRRTPPNRNAAGELHAPLKGQHREGPVRLVIRSYDLKFWKDDKGIATVERVVTLGDRVRIHAALDGAGPIVAQFPRRSSLLKGIEPGSRIAVEVTSARTYPVETAQTQV